MSECATLTIQRKISRGRDPIFDVLYEAKKRGESVEQVLRREKREDDNYEKVRFIEHLSGVYYEHLSWDQNNLDSTQLQMEMDIPNEWLLCFSYQEMEVLGIPTFTFGIFQAEASVEEVIERLQYVECEINSELFHKRNNLLRWIRANARLDDRIFLCSHWIFYHEENKYDYDFVRNLVNNRIAKIRQEAKINHWSKNAVVRPKQMSVNDIQMTA